MVLTIDCGVFCAGNYTHVTCLHTNGMFECTSGECIEHKKVCNGVKDCGSGDDEGSHCDQKQTCKNHKCSQECYVSPHGNECFCRDGYELMSDGITCKDIDECKEPGYCSQLCTNKHPGFECQCMDGYE